ncbi:MAG TPA: hypothetical protein VGR18_03170 [Rubrobacter sp.]|nr:hypothetical protein [Rubrobacter sp.]
MALSRVVATLDKIPWFARAVPVDRGGNVLAGGFYRYRQGGWFLPEDQRDAHPLVGSSTSRIEPLSRPVKTLSEGLGARTGEA